MFKLNRKDYEQLLDELQTTQTKCNTAATHVEDAVRTLNSILEKKKAAKKARGRRWNDKLKPIGGHR